MAGPTLREKRREREAEATTNGAVSAPTLVERVLAEDGARTREALLRHLPGEDDELLEVLADYPTRPAKGIRPALCLAACRAHGGRTEDALGAAVAIELLHNAFLVHDDICDAASTRRGQPTLHLRHGVPVALTTGDALGWLALEPLLDSVEGMRRGVARAAMGEFQNMIKRTIAGQLSELRWRTRGLAELTVDDYLKLILDKTCWYSAIHPCRVGALLGSRGRAELDGLARFGFFVGAVLQIRDDIENVTDRHQVHGKDFGSDVIEGKPTLLLVHLLRTAAPPLREEVLDLVGPRGDGGGLSRSERIERVVVLLEEHGSIDYCCEFADGLAGGALAEFDTALGGLPWGRDKAFLRELVLHLRDPVIRGR